MNKVISVWEFYSNLEDFVPIGVFATMEEAQTVVANRKEVWRDRMRVLGYDETDAPVCAIEEDHDQFWQRLTHIGMTKANVMSNPSTDEIELQLAAERGEL